ncbi:MAG: response regulator [Gammaproteobacteria bacterium]
MARRRFKFLVVDASGVSRTVITRVLSEQVKGLEVVGARSAEEALELAACETFDAVSTSVVLPGEDGLGFGRRLRALPGYGETPLLLISSDADESRFRDDHQARITEVFDKTDGFEALAEFLCTFVRRGHLLSGRVLYVEDSLLAMRIIRDIMERNGLEVTHVVSAEQAVELLEAHDTPEEIPYDMVISDYMLKGRMTGKDLVARMRGEMNLDGRRLPVLILTVNQDQRQQAELFRCGANDFVPKPVEEDILMARVRTLMLLNHHTRALDERAAARRRAAQPARQHLRAWRH